MIRKAQNENLFLCPTVSSQKITLSNSNFLKFFFFFSHTLQFILHGSINLAQFIIAIFHIANNVHFFNITYKTWDKNVPVWLSKLFYQIVVAVQSLSCVRFFVIPWTAACQAFLSSTISQSLIH